MIALFCLCLALFASPFKSRRRLEAENAALRHQLIVLRRKVRGRVRLTDGDRLFFVSWSRPRTLQLMSERRILCLKSALRLEWRGEQVQEETEKRDHRG